MSNSALANYVNRTAGRYTERREDTLIDRITIHSADASGDCYDLSELVMAAEKSSYHYGISSDGTVCLFVDEEFRSWSTGSVANDEYAVNIICMNDPKGIKEGKLTDATYNALLDLCTDICRRNYMLELVYTGNKSTSTLTMHKWFASVNCPGTWLSNRFSQIAAIVTERLQDATKAQNKTEALKAQSTIAVGNIKPYMITVTPGTLGVNYQRMRTFGVVGTMFWAGSRFDGRHSVRATYMNSSLKNQVAEANHDEMPYALYATVRANTEQEAKDECYWLYFVISKYPPKLGLWLELDLSGTPQSRQKVIDVYYKNILKWGLKDKCGFYATRDQLMRLGYKEYLDRFSVWLISPMDDLSSLDSLLTPAIFKF